MAKMMNVIFSLSCPPCENSASLNSCCTWCWPYKDLGCLAWWWLTEHVLLVFYAALTHLLCSCPFLPTPDSRTPIQHLQCRANFPGCTGLIQSDPDQVSAYQLCVFTSVKIIPCLLSPCFLSLFKFYIIK